ncbi:hypothetical protein [Chryseobacterium luquanense]|uniref:HTH cro/C1-type domain-containing protein n=1 Tax=Chryseobacterium luquanense TaxID=2983766 RepID=A0ABT3Y4J4_9FLAO|nr:hypothetical protein [Chryseobacterium luquanense]MCX8533058.1 hypothetical protein [Chryseobacterium luquanense]
MSNIEIGQLYGCTSATVGNYLNGNREIPSDFIVWLKITYPDIDLNILFKDDEITEISVVKLVDNTANKREMLKDIEGILNKYLQ